MCHNRSKHCVKESWRHISACLDGIAPSATSPRGHPVKNNNNRSIKRSSDGWIWNSVAQDFYLLLPPGSPAPGLCQGRIIRSGAGLSHPDNYCRLVSWVVASAPLKSIPRASQIALHSALLMIPYPDSGLLISCAVNQGNRLYWLTDRSGTRWPVTANLARRWPVAQHQWATVHR